MNKGSIIKNFPLRKRYVRTVLILFVLGAGIYLIISHGKNISQVLHLLDKVSMSRFVISIVAEILSMMAFARLQRRLLWSGGVKLKLLAMAEITFAGNALGAALPGGAVWSATWSFGQLRRQGIKRSTVIWALLLSGILSTSILILIISIGILIAGSRGPLAGVRSFVIGLLALIVTFVLAIKIFGNSGKVKKIKERYLQPSKNANHQSQTPKNTLNALLREIGAIHSSSSGWLRAWLFALANWLFDAACLATSIWALHANVPWRGFLAIYGLTQIAASLPITPGGLGVVEASLAALLTAYGMPATMSLAVTVLYRSISFWALQPIGWGTWIFIELSERFKKRRQIINE